ncbi:MAG: hypothetical protein NVS4B11_24240 [Ktedonobacteraceae bacterium]
MKQKFLILGTLVTLVFGVLGMVLALQHAPAQVHAARGKIITPLFQDNFDSYTAPGPLPTGTGTNQWTSVNIKGAGAVSVSNTYANSAPNSLQITLGASTTKEFAYAKTKYSASYTKHAAKVAVYLPTGFSTPQSITLFGTQNSTNLLNGSFSVVLAANKTLQVLWYTSTGTKVSHTTSTKLVPGTWSTIELDQTNSATTGSWFLYSNGTQIASRVTTDTGSLPIDTFVAGDTISYIATMSNAFYEDNVETATSHIG